MPQCQVLIHHYFAKKVISTLLTLCAIGHPSPSTVCGNPLGDRKQKTNMKKRGVGVLVVKRRSLVGVLAMRRNIRMLAVAKIITGVLVLRMKAEVLAVRRRFVEVVAVSKRRVGVLALRRRRVGVLAVKRGGNWWKS